MYDLIATVLGWVFGLGVIIIIIAIPLVLIWGVLQN